MKYLIALIATGSILLISTCPSSKAKSFISTNSHLDSCYFDGKRLFGKVKLVENKYQADVTVKIVSSFPDLKVKFVESFPDDCGEWQIVEYGENLRVYVTNNFEDIRVKPVSNFPGLD